MKKCILNKRLKFLPNGVWLVKRIWKDAPDYLILALFNGIMLGLYHAANILYIQQIFNALGHNEHITVIIKMTCCFGIYLLAFWVFEQWYTRFFRPQVQERIQASIHRDMFQQAVRIDLSSYDDSSFYNEFIWAMDKSSKHTLGFVDDLSLLVSRLLSSFSVIGMIINIDITTAIVIILLSCTKVILNSINNKIQLQQSTLLTPLNIRSTYINRVFRLPDYSKEIRISDVSKILFEKHEETYAEKRKLLLQFASKYASIFFAQDFVTIAGDLGLLVFILYQVMVTQENSLGNLAVIATSSWKVSWLLGEMCKQALKLQNHSLFVEKMIHFLNRSPVMIDGLNEASDFESMEIKNVSFSYSSLEPKSFALNNISMEVRRGEKIALVGYNGAGKSTLTKLILRLYDPTAGKILYNGKDIREYSVESLRCHIGTVLQDYQIFAGSIAENVVGGEVTDTQSFNIEQALKQSVFCDKEGDLCYGLDTQLTKEFDLNGIQLSGGEKQKIALARAFFKKADLLILDEPSSALDPNAEYQLNKTICDYCKSATVIFVSHRLTTTMNADRIYMFERGQIIESGTHDELMSLNGKYANMFKTQAKRYNLSQTIK